MARAARAFVFRSCRVVGGSLGVGRFARSLALVASASVASALLRDRWAGGCAGGNSIFICCYGGSCVRLPVGGVGHVRQLVASDVSRRVVVR